MEDVNMTITYLLQILADAAKGDAKKYGIIPDINLSLIHISEPTRRTQ